jgi:O-antigen/teichoic acid export membrane protein
VGLFGSGASVVLKLAQTALLTKALGVEDFGRVLVVVNLPVFLEAFVGLRVSDALFRFFRQLEERGDAHALRGLLLLCLSLSIATGLLIAGAVFALSPWVAGRFYHSPGLAPLFRIYVCTVLFTSLREVYEPVLRIHDRFAAVVVPQALGGLATLAALAAYLSAAGAYDLRAVVAAFALGSLVQSVPPLVSALRLLRPRLSGLDLKAAARGLKRHRARLLGCLLHSNLSGYLKFANDPGDVFLLGLFAGPAQVALYGVARQLTAPLALLQSNAQTAVTPQLVSLAAAGRFAQARRVARRYVWAAAAWGAAAVACGLLFGRPVVAWLTRPEYLAALPVFYVLLLVASLMLAAAVFRPLALGLDMLRWYNLGLLLSTTVVLAFAFAGKLDAAGMAFAQLAGAVLQRVLCNVPVWLRLRAGAGEGARGVAEPGL